MRRMSEGSRGRRGTTASRAAQAASSSCRCDQIVSSCNAARFGVVRSACEPAQKIGFAATHDHCASQPCSVTAPSGVVRVVSGNPPATQGFPGLVEKRLSSSWGESAPSRSWSKSSKMSVKNW